MINPENLPIDIEAERSWLNSHKQATSMSWSQLAPRIGVPQGTLSPFALGSYAGDNARIAETVYRYRQTLTAQAELAIELPEPPDFYETPTSRQIGTMLKMAQRGRMVVVAGGPGASKTKTIRQYQSAMANVWVATMKPSTAGVNTMQQKVLEAMGEIGAKGTPLALSTKIESIVRNTGGLLIIDEAQHTSELALEEIRGWHDETGVGIALVGNEDVLTRLTLGNKRDAFARLASRISQRMIFSGPTDADAVALAEAWGVTEATMQAFIVDIARKPGGLRTCTMMMETACMLAAGDGTALAITHLQDSWAHLAAQRRAA
ncbi:AAA family ATPase [Sphingomonas panni]|uniref:AAA family ATPase n=1 Tax=Sphingomonas panni TaxID=237612 RepID=UPI001F5BDDC5|nr:AAA family ATPase [Sphingomonas panni]